MQRKFNFEIDGFYHLYNRGTEKRIIFLDQADHRRFSQLLHLSNNIVPVSLSQYRGLSSVNPFDLVAEEKLVEIGAYCLMPNHFHLLVKEIKEGGISLFMRKLLTGYSMFFNKRYERSGALFQGPFKAVEVEDDVQLQYLFAYIHLNPLKLCFPKWREKPTSIAEAKRFLDNYRHSSYAEHCLGETRPENAILGRSKFPEYFSTPNEAIADLYSWLEDDPDNPEESPREMA